MAVVGIHASHEQVHPAALLAPSSAPRRPGSTAPMCSDHFAPWSVRQGHSGFAWAWLGAALATPPRCRSASSTRPASGTTRRSSRRRSATLAAMFPGRFWVALGSGENVNEHITGDRWPDKAKRDARLRECVERHPRAARRRGGHARRAGRGGPRQAVDAARRHQPLLIGPAVSRETARAHAGWADGLVTVNQPPTSSGAMIERVPRRRRARHLAPAGAPVWAPPTTGRAGHRPRPVAGQRVRAAGVLGPGRHPGGVRLHRRARPGDEVRRSVLVDPRPGPAGRPGARARRPSASTPVYLHHVGQHRDRVRRRVRRARGRRGCHAAKR